MTRRILYALAALAAVLLIAWAIFAGLGAHHAAQGGHAEAVSHQQDQEAQTHAQAAQAIPDHAAELAATQASVDRARAEVARLRKLLAAKPSVPIPDPAGPGASDVPALPVDHRDEVLAAQAVLIQAQDQQITGLKLALTDEQGRSSQWKAAYQHEQAARLAQEAATRAWKSAVKESRWRGRIEGFAAGVALGYAGGKL